MRPVSGQDNVLFCKYVVLISAYKCFLLILHGRWYKHRTRGSKVTVSFMLYLKILFLCNCEALQLCLWGVQLLIYLKGDFCVSRNTNFKGQT